MSDDLKRFEYRLRKQLEEFNTPEEKKSKGRRVEPTCSVVKGRIVKIAVREKQLSMDHVFVHESTSISKLQAEQEAHQAARAANWPIIGWTYSNDLIK